MGRFRDSFEFMDDSRRQRERFGDNESDSVTGNVSVRSDLCDLDVVVHHGTDKALLLSVDGNNSRAVWLPRSQFEIEHKAATVAGTDRHGQVAQLGAAVITLKTAVAKEKGLL